MRRLLTVISTTLLLILAVTSPAYATFADWLDKLAELSGPGPFIQRAGVSVDLICREGKWFKDPTKTRALDVSLDFERQVLQALGANVNNPFAITETMKTVSIPPAPQRGPREANAVKTLPELYAENQAATLATLQLRARSLYWELREKILDAHGRQTPEQVLIANGLNPSLADRYTDSLAIAFSPFCAGDLRKPRQSLGVYTAWFTTDDVPADYVYAPDVAAKSERINAVPIAGTVRFTVPGVSEAHPVFLRSYDLGFSAGYMVFSGERLKKTLVSPYFEFPRVAFRPLAMVACERRLNGCPGEWTTWDMLEVEFLGKLLPGFDPQDFGAIAGPSSDWHWQWTLRVGVSVKINRGRVPASF